MAIEIERKFLVTTSSWRASARDGTRYRQGYVAITPQGVVRARSGGGNGYVTLKGPRVGARRAEFEYAVPAADADEIIDTLCDGRVVEKTRYRIRSGGLLWEVDEFHGANEGLVLAEVELAEERQAFQPPPWVGPEVTEDDRYANSSLATRPWTTWRHAV